VESRDIYLGAIPFIIIQLLLVGVVIFFPQTVTVFLDKEKVLDLEKAMEQLQEQ
jgi:NhaP-type Na+/H+ or K+/H+ antiporter